MDSTGVLGDYALGSGEPSDDLLRQLLAVDSGEWSMPAIGMGPDARSMIYGGGTAGRSRLADMLKKVAASRQGGLAVPPNDDSSLQKLLAKTNPTGASLESVNDASMDLPLSPNQASRGASGALGDGVTNADFTFKPWELEQAAGSGGGSKPGFSWRWNGEPTTIEPGMSATELMGAAGPAVAGEAVLNRLLLPQTGSRFQHGGPPTPGELVGDFAPNTEWGSAVTPEREAAAEASANQRRAIAGLQSHMAGRQGAGAGESQRAPLFTGSALASSDGQDPAFKKVLGSVLGDVTDEVHQSPGATTTASGPGNYIIKDPTAEITTSAAPGVSLHQMIQRARDIAKQQRPQFQTTSSDHSPLSTDLVGTQLYRELGGGSNYDPNSQAAKTANQAMKAALGIQ